MLGSGIVFLFQEGHVAKSLICCRNLFLVQNLTLMFPTILTLLRVSPQMNPEMMISFSYRMICSNCCTILILIFLILGNIEMSVYYMS